MATTNLQELSDTYGDRLASWSIDDLYLGSDYTYDSSKKLWLPRVGDVVYDQDVGIYFVISVSDEGVPTLELKQRFDVVSQYNLQSTSLITATSLYSPSVAQRLFINTETTPYECQVDNAFRIYDDQPVKMRFFKGTDITEDTGTIISEVYNSDGDLTSDYVQLRDLTDTDTVKIPNSFYTTNASVVDGDIVTGVSYTSSGNVFRTQAFLVTNTAAIMPVDSTNVYITAVTLSGTIVSTTEDYTINNVVGNSLDTNLLTGVLHYSDGSTTTRSIDGSKMVLIGVDDYDTSYIGNPTKLTLAYYPDEDEYYINGGISVNTPAVTQIYSVKNVSADSAYSLKIFVIPTWDSTNTTYTFTYWLVNDTGDLYQDVTDLVSVALASGGSFNGADFGTEQTVHLALDMDEVSPTAYSGYTHTQNFSITLYNPEGASGMYWTIDYTNDGLNVYGATAYASISSDGAQLNFYDCFDFNGDTSTDVQTDWLKLLYGALDPIYDNDTADEAPTPTGFRWRYNDTVSDIHDLSEWADTFTEDSGTFSENDTIILEFILTTDDGDYVKCATPLFTVATIGSDS